MANKRFRWWMDKHTRFAYRATVCDIESLARENVAGQVQVAFSAAHCDIEPLVGGSVDGRVQFGSLSFTMCVRIQPLSDHPDAVWGKYVYVINDDRYFDPKLEGA